MENIGALFKSREELTDALVDLDENGFEMFTVFGPEDLFSAPRAAESVEEEMENAAHTAAGTVSGISVNPHPHAGDSGAQPAAEKIREMGLSTKAADYLTAGLQQDRLALIVGAKVGRTEEVRNILRDHGAFMLAVESTV